MATRNVLLGVERPSDVSVDDAILDAVRRCVLAYGVRRTTLTEVAREAGVSRPTVYRRSPDVAALVADLLTREVLSLLGDATSGGTTADGDRARTVAVVVDTVAAVRDNELFRRILDTDPELLGTYTFRRLGQSQVTVLGVLRAAVVAGQAAGTIRRGDPDQLAAVVLLLAQSAVFSAQLVSHALSTSQLDDELRIALEGYLQP